MGQKNSKKEKEVIPSLTPEEEEQQQKHRFQIISEIVDTERKYSASLRTCCNAFMSPLLNNPKPLIKPEDVRLIFSVMPDLAAFHETFYQELQEVIDKWGKTSCVGPVFLKSSEQLKMVSTYVNEYPTALVTLSHYMTKNSKFVSFLAEARRTPGSNGLDIQSYLIMPIQRLPRYVLLLTDLVKHTHISHPGYKDLNLALQKAREVTTYVNEAKRAAENSEKIIEIQNSIINITTMIARSEGKGEDEGELLAPNRKFLSEGMMRLIAGPKEKPKKSLGASSSYVSSALKYYLFSDAILLTVPERKLIGGVTDRFEAKEWILMKDCEIKSLDDGADSSALFEIRIGAEGDNVYIVELEKGGQKEKEEWIKDFYWMRSKILSAPTQNARTTSSISKAKKDPSVNKLSMGESSNRNSANNTGKEVSKTGSKLNVKRGFSKAKLGESNEIEKTPIKGKLPENSKEKDKAKSK